jgi:hypothetical protein
LFHRPERSPLKQPWDHRLFLHRSLGLASIAQLLP